MMSLWIPKRGRDGRWSFYCVEMPLQLLLFIFVLLVTFVFFVLGLFR